MRNFFALLVLLILFLPNAVFADSAPSLVTPGAVGPITESPIVMDHEEVVFRVPLELGPSSPLNEEAAGTIPAEATFWFRNPTSETVFVPSVFPLTWGGDTDHPRFYAEQVTVLVDDRPVTGAYEPQATYPEHGYKNPQAFEPASGPGYAFTFSISPGATAKVTIRFAAPVVADNEGVWWWNYLLASGAGWAGPIDRAVIRIEYPDELPADWLEQTWMSSQEPFRVASDNRSIVWEKEQYEPQFQDAPWMSVPNPALLRAIRTAQSAATAKPGDLRLWQEYADVCRNMIELGSGGPRFAHDCYWEAMRQVITLKYGALDDARSPAEALRLAEIYSDSWHTEMAGKGDYEIVNVELYNALMKNVRRNLQRDWLWLGDDIPTARILYFLDRGWVTSRTELFNVARFDGENMIPLPAAAEPVLPVQDSVTPAPFSARGPAAPPRPEQKPLSPRDALPMLGGALVGAGIAWLLSRRCRRMNTGT